MINKQIILTSTGLENKEVIDNIFNIVGSFEKIKMLVIPQARLGDYNKTKYLNDYIEIGFKENNIFFLDDIDTYKFEDLNIDMFYVCGGNTFLLKKFLSDTKFDKAILHYISKGVIYLGASAGSQIATKNIKHIELFDSNYINISDYNGLNLLDALLICHYNEDRKKFLESHNISFKYKTFYISDNQILYINKNSIKII